VKPCSIYSPLWAHTFFTRYAKNHWKDLMMILDDVYMVENDDSLLPK